MTIHKKEKYLSVPKIALILPMVAGVKGLQFFNEDFEGKIMNGLNELRKASEKREEEIKKFGEETAETKRLITNINEEITTLQKQMNDLAAQVARKHENSYETKTAEAQQKEYERKEAFIAWARKGKAALTPEQKTALATVPMELKALVEDTTGEILVPEDLDETIYTGLYEEVQMRQLAFVRPTDSNRVRRIGMNQLTSGWGKIETSATQKLTDYESTLVPYEDYITVQNLYGMTKLGEDELMDSALNLVQYLAQAYQSEFRVRESEGFLRGEGSSKNQPDGVLNDLNIKRLVSGVATGIELDDFLKLMYEVPAQYRASGAFLTSSAVELALRTLKDGNGLYLWQPSVQAGKPNTFMGKDLRTEDHFDEIVTDGQVAVFGDFKKGYQIVDRRGLAIQRLDEKYAEEDMVGFKAKKRVGGGVVRPEALAILKVQ